MILYFSEYHDLNIEMNYYCHYELVISTNHASGVVL